MTDVVVIDDDTTQVVEIPTTAPSFVIDGIDGEVLVVSSGSEIVVENGNAEPVVEVMTQTKGDKGDTGLQGPRGLNGERGVQGERGLRGFEGQQGPRGFRGFGGIGAPGPTGPQGSAGEVKPEDVLIVITPILNDAAVVPIAELRADVNKVPVDILSAFLGDVAGSDQTESSWAAGDDDGHYVGTVTVASMITDKDYSSYKGATTAVAKVGENLGAIRKEQLIQVDAMSATVRQLETFIAQTGNNLSVVEQQITVATTLSYATATSLTQLSAETATALAQVTDQIDLIVTDLEANIEATNVFIAQIGDNVTSLSETVELHTGMLGNTSSSYQLVSQAVDGDKVVLTGMALGASIGNDGSYRSEVLFMADVVGFMTKNDGTVHQPFVFDVVNDTAYLNTAIIQHASIGSAKFSDWLESDALGVGGIPVLRMNFRTGEIQLNAPLGGGGYMLLTNQVIKVFDASNVLRVHIGNLAV